MLVFSVDPQASLTDIFKRDIFGKGPVKIMDNLWAQEIDADSHIRTYQQEIRQKILDMYGLPKVPEEIENYIRQRAPSRRWKRARFSTPWSMWSCRATTTTTSTISSPSARALLPVDGQRLRRVDQQDY